MAARVRLFAGTRDRSGRTAPALSRARLRDLRVALPRAPGLRHAVRRKGPCGSPRRCARRSRARSARRGCSTSSSSGGCVIRSRASSRPPSTPIVEVPHSARGTTSPARSSACGICGTQRSTSRRSPARRASGARLGADAASCCQSGADCWPGAATSSARIALSSASACERAADHASSSSGARPPSPGDFVRDRLARARGPPAASRAATSFLPIFAIGPASLGSGRFFPVAERGRRPLQVAHDLAHALRLEREAWSVPFAGRLSVKCFSMTRRAEHVGGERPSRSRCRGRRSRRRRPGSLAVRRDDAQVELLHVGRVAGGALEQADLRVDRGDRLERAVDVVERRAAGGDDHRLADLGDVAEERRVAEVARGDLVGRHVELGEEVGARASKAVAKKSPRARARSACSSAYPARPNSSASRCSP